MHSFYLEGKITMSVCSHVSWSIAVVWLYVVQGYRAALPRSHSPANRRRISSRFAFIQTASTSLGWHGAMDMWPEDAAVIGISTPNPPLFLVYHLPSPALRLPLSPTQFLTSFC